MNSDTISQYDIQAETFLFSNSLQFSFHLPDSESPLWEGPHGHHYRIEISRDCGRGDQALTFDFWSSLNDKEKGVRTVKPYAVLACISSDASCPDTFEDFCSEYGYDTDSRKALATFEAVHELAEKMRVFFTEEELSQLSEIQ